MAAEKSVTMQHFTGNDDVSIGVKNSQRDIKQTITDVSRREEYFMIGEILAF
jgi:hypothetical protein